MGTGADKELHLNGFIKCIDLNLYTKNEKLITNKIRVQQTTKFYKTLKHKTAIGCVKFYGMPLELLGIPWDFQEFAKNSFIFVIGIKVHCHGVWVVIDKKGAQVNFSCINLMLICLIVSTNFVMIVYIVINQNWFSFGHK